MSTRKRARAKPEAPRWRMPEPHELPLSHPDHPDNPHVAAYRAKDALARELAVRYGMPRADLWQLLWLLEQRGIDWLVEGPKWAEYLAANGLAPWAVEPYLEALSGNPDRSGDPGDGPLVGQAPG